MELIIKRDKKFRMISRKYPSKEHIINTRVFDNFITRRHIPEDIADLAARKGIFGLVKYLNNKGLEVGKNGINEAAGNGHLEMVKYLHKKFGLEVDQDGIYWAAGHGHLEMVKYLVRELGELSSDQIDIDWTAENGHLEMVKYLHKEFNLKVGQNGIEWTPGNGHIEMVKYLIKEFGLKVDQRGINWAAGNGHIEMVQYLIKEFGLKLKVPEDMRIIFDNFYYP